MHDINANLIQYFRPFYYVAKTGSIRRAAAFLNLTPSAVSQQIQKLEEEIGMPLFDRSPGRSLRLLPAGQTLLAHIPSLEKAFAQLRLEIRNLQEHQPPVRIGILTLLHVRMLKSIADYTALYPETAFRLRAGDGSSLYRRLVAGELDFALLFREHLPPSVEAVPLLSTPLMLVVHRDLVRNTESKTSLDLLAELPIVYVNGGWMNPTFDAYVSAGLTMRKRLTVESPIWALEAVRLKLGAAIVCTLVLPEDMGDLKAYPLEPALPPRRIVLACAPESPHSTECLRFKRFITDTWLNTEQPGAQLPKV